MEEKKLKCMHCHRCQESCTFLSKYKIDIGDSEALKKLAYHCFLCGKCTEVCPIGIDGREIVLKLRQEQTAADGGEWVKEKYKRTLSEKLDYSYRNYRHATKNSVLFPGCNFPSVYPKTAKKLSELLMEKAGIGTIYDCCGKPISDLGLFSDETKILAGLEERLKASGVTELVTVCPNCYDYLKPRLSVEVVNIYDKLRELHLGNKIPGGGRMFTPCPDRAKREWLKSINLFMEKESDIITDIECCGLGGQAPVMEPEMAKSFAKSLKDCPDAIYTYCGSCAGNLTRNGCRQVKHVLPEILGTGEKPDTVMSLINRMRTKHV